MLDEAERKPALIAWIDGVTHGSLGHGNDQDLVLIQATCEQADIPVELILHVSDAVDLRKQLKQAIRAIERRAARVLNHDTLGGVA